MSKNTLKLGEPITINGKQVSELTYDPMEITAAQFSEACARSSAINKSKSFSFKMRENDYALHLYLGMFAVIAVNPEIDISDLEPNLPHKHPRNWTNEADRLPPGVRGIGGRREGAAGQNEGQQATL